VLESTPPSAVAMVFCRNGAMNSALRRTESSCVPEDCRSEFPPCSAGVELNTVRTKYSKVPERIPTSLYGFSALERTVARRVL
jgi:hypothetical protein